MKTGVKVERPSFIPEEEWELDGYLFDIDDKLQAALREDISRLANMLAIRVVRIAEDGISQYEDPQCARMSTDLFRLCRQAVKGITHAGKELSPDERRQALDEMNILSKDQLANEVAGLNTLGLKKK